jgi:hypothetical protein
MNYTYIFLVLPLNTAKYPVLYVKKAKQKVYKWWKGSRLAVDLGT